MRPSSAWARRLASLSACGRSGPSSEAKTRKTSTASASSASLATGRPTRARIRTAGRNRYPRAMRGMSPAGSFTSGSRRVSASCASRPPDVSAANRKSTRLNSSHGYISHAGFCLNTKGRMVFANDQLLSREVLSESLKQLGVIWLPLEHALVEYPDLLQQYFMREEQILGAQTFAA